MHAYYYYLICLGLARFDKKYSILNRNIIIILNNCFRFEYILKCNFITKQGWTINRKVIETYVILPSQLFSFFLSN